MRSVVFQIEDVDVFVGSVDGSLRCRHEQERLSAIIGRIDSYDCVVRTLRERVTVPGRYSIAVSIKKPNEHSR